MIRRRGIASWTVLSGLALGGLAQAAAAQPLDDIVFAASWPVRAPGARAGEWVRLRVPVGVYGHLEWPGGLVSRLRLASAGQLVPFREEWGGEEPLQGVRLRREIDEVATFFQLTLPARRLPVSQIVLEARPAVFRRDLKLRFEGEEGPEAEWSCHSTSVPCRFTWPVRLIAPRQLVLSIEHGENPPLQDVEIALWVEARDLVFVWPARGLARGEVRLLTGQFENLPPIEYGLESSEPEVTRQAVLGLRSAGPFPAAGGPVLAALGLTAVLMLSLVGWRRWRMRRAFFGLGLFLAADLPALDRAATAPRVVQDPSRYAASWPVLAPGARTGQVVRLEVPAEVYARSFPDLVDVRLEAGEQRIPYVADPLADPALVASYRNDGEVRREARLGLPSPGLPVTVVRLTSYSAPGSHFFHARLGSRILDGDWKCPSLFFVPCRVELEAREGEQEESRLPDVLTLTGTGYLPASYEVQVYRRRDVLAFVWPGEPVTLLAGAEDRRPPRYDLAVITSELRAQPWLPARLGERRDLHALPKFLEPRGLGLYLAMALLLLGLVKLVREIAPPSTDAAPRTGAS